MDATLLPTETSHRAAAPRASRGDIASGHGAGRALAGAVAIACLVAGWFLTTGYPLAPMAVAACFVAWVAFATWRISYALAALIAAVPVIGLAAWTGWLTFEETDLVILATAAGGYAARAFVPRSVQLTSRATSRGSSRLGSRLSIISLSLLALFLASACIALGIGVIAAGGWRFEWFGGYYSPMNSVRLFKSFAFALLMTPLLIDEMRRSGGLDRIGLAMTIGLGLCGLSVVQERIAFTGLLSFSEDYRVTAPFWEMHTGGAALDGYLALTIPFAIRDALRAKDRVRFGIALGVLALAAYAVLVTFSRGVYAAVPLSLFVIAVLTLRQRGRFGRGDFWITLAKAAVFIALVSLAGVCVFRSGGYRTMLATFIVVALAIPAEQAMRRATRRDWVATAVLAILTSAFGWLVGLVVPAGPYVVFVVLASAAFGVLWRSETGRAPTAPPWLLVTWFGLAAAAVQVGGHWGGSQARADAALVMMAIVVGLLILSRTRRSWLPTTRREQLGVVAATGILFAIIAVFMAGAYMGGRFSTSNSDLQGRLSHWRGGLARLHGTDWLFGKGLGRFPASSLYEADDGSSPGRADVISRGGGRFVALSTSRLYMVNFDEWFRLSQRVLVARNTTYHLVVSARAPEASALHVELCEQELLYHGDCRFAAFAIPGGVDGWTDFTARITTEGLGGWRGAGTRPVFLALANKESKSIIDIRAVHLIGPDGRDVITNGDFANGLERWFSTSNRWHLPWHIKNLALAVLFDQGLIGLALFTLLVAGAFLRTAAGRAYRHPDAPFVAAAIVGYVVVGAFDSLLDVPRVAFLFYLVMIAALALRNPPVDKPRVGGAPAVAPRPPPDTLADDAAETHAQRRQRAFGHRRPPRPA